MAASNLERGVREAKTRQPNDGQNKKGKKKNKIEKTKIQKEKSKSQKIEKKSRNKNTSNQKGKKKSRKGKEKKGKKKAMKRNKKKKAGKGKDKDRKKFTVRKGKKKSGKVKIGQKNGKGKKQKSKRKNTKTRTNKDILCTTIDYAAINKYVIYRQIIDINKFFKRLLTKWSNVLSFNRPAAAMDISTITGTYCRNSAENLNGQLSYDTLKNCSVSAEISCNPNLVLNPTELLRAQQIEALDRTTCITNGYALYTNNFEVSIEL